MDRIYNSPIFSGLTRLEIDLLLEGRSRFINYKAGELIALQGAIYHSLLVVCSGVVRGEMVGELGNSVIIEEIEAPRVVAPAILFASENVLPVSVIALTNVEIVAIKSRDFTEIMQLDYRILHNFVRSISDRSKFLSDRVRAVSFGTIKSKLANYLLKQMERSRSVEFTIPNTHQELADLYGVTRPAVSRAISQMAKLGAFVSNKGEFKIVDEKLIRRIAAK